MEGVRPPVLVMFSPSVPLPVPVLAVTVQTEGPPVTDVIAGAPLNPPLIRVKLAALSPVTLALKVTVQETAAV
ncbi:hypothetical protein D3C83_221500 [compost metagenome]